LSYIFFIQLAFVTANDLKDKMPFEAQSTHILESPHNISEGFSYLESVITDIEIQLFCIMVSEIVVVFQYFPIMN
jgi:hypothetical protein